MFMKTDPKTDLQESPKQLSLLLTKLWSQTKPAKLLPSTSAIATTPSLAEINQSTLIKHYNNYENETQMSIVHGHAVSIFQTMARIPQDSCKAALISWARVQLLGNIYEPQATKTILECRLFHIIVHWTLSLVPLETLIFPWRIMSAVTTGWFRGGRARG